MDVVPQVEPAEIVLIKPIGQSGPIEREQQQQGQDAPEIPLTKVRGSVHVGTSRKRRIGEKMSQRVESRNPPAPTNIAPRSPTHSANAPPTSAPIGNTPRNIRCAAEFTRPNKRLGATAWRSVTSLML